MKKRQKVYDLYWYFAYERQNIFWKKINGDPAPWTDDKILQEYKFCNSYRVNDRVSQYLLKNVIYNGKKYSDEDMLFRILLFKLFNKESTWELLLNNFEDITLKTFDIKKLSNILENAISNSIKIYNDAYISCANKAFGYDRKHDNHLALLDKMFNEDKIQNKIIKCKTMKEAFNIIKSYPLIGNFMAYQLVTDINYSEVVNWKEDEFTVAGPGSLRGIKKCFIDKGKMSNEDIIKYMYEHQDEEFKRLNLGFKRIGNRPLQLVDCQNIFCELDKYCRQALPDLKSNRTKIKKHYIPKKDKIKYIYPLKWNLHIGVCHICEEYDNLTFEHIPPRKAFNFNRARLITGNEIIKTIADETRLPWDYSNLNYENKQRGVGLYSLCSNCNNVTGALYGEEYIKFAYTVDKLLRDNNTIDKQTVGIYMEEIYLSRIAKQILSMFCSTYPGFVKTHPIIKELILNKDKILDDFSKFRITMFLLKEYKIGYTGLTAMYTGGKIVTIAEIDAYPFGFILELDPKTQSTDLDITNFLSHKYDEKYNIEFGINIHERNIMFPADFRTKEEILKCQEENRKNKVSL